MKYEKLNKIKIIKIILLDSVKHESNSYLGLHLM
jgi:hypothetical protein